MDIFFFYKINIKYLLNVLLFIILIFFMSNLVNKISKEIHEIEKGNLNGTFIINYNNKKNLYLSCEKDKLIVAQKNVYFDIIQTNRNSYYIICKDQGKIIGIDKDKGNEVLLYPIFDAEKKNLNRN